MNTEDLKNKKSKYANYLIIALTVLFLYTCMKSCSRGREVNRLEKKRKQMQRDIYAQEDEIDMQKDRLQEEIRQKLNGNSEVTHIMTISFEIV